jgi:hypothetical protein
LQANGITRFGSMIAPDGIAPEPKSGVFMRGCVISTAVDAVVPYLWAIRLGDTNFPEVSICATILLNQTYPGRFSASLALEDQIFGEPPCVTDASKLPKEEIITEFAPTQSALLSCPGQVRRSTQRPLYLANVRPLVRLMLQSAVPALLLQPLIMTRVVVDNLVVLHVLEGFTTEGACCS